MSAAPYVQVERDGKAFRRWADGYETGPYWADLVEACADSVPTWLFREVERAFAGRAEVPVGELWEAAARLGVRAYDACTAAEASGYTLRPRATALSYRGAAKGGAP